MYYCTLKAFGLVVRVYDYCIFILNDLCADGEIKEIH